MTNWIKCSDRLPDYYEHVLLIFENKVRCGKLITRFDDEYGENGEAWFDIYDHGDYIPAKRIKKWIPLPTTGGRE